MYESAHGMIGMDSLVFASRQPPRRRHGLPVAPTRVLRAVRDGRWWLVGAFAGGVLLSALALTLLFPRTYRASAALVFEGLPPIEGVRSTDERALATLVDSVKLPTNVREVRERLHLGAPISVLGARIQVKRGDGNVFRVEADAKTAEDAQALADNVVHVFLARQAASEEGRLRGYLAKADLDLRAASSELARANKAYDEFRRTRGVSDLSTEHQRAIEQTAELRAQADMARAEATAQQARVAALQSAVRRQSSVVMGVESKAAVPGQEIARLKEQLAQARAQYSNDHPRVRGLEARISSLMEEPAPARKVASDRILGSSPSYQALQQSVTGSAAEREAAAQRMTAYETLAQAAQRRVEELSSMESDASNLLARVRLSEEHVAQLRAVRQRVLDALREPNTGFRLMAPTMVPDTPERSAKRMAVGTAIPLLAVLLAIFGLLSREFWGFRVVTPSEASFWGGGPVVGATAWPRQPDALPDLIEELDDSIPDTRGATLIVSARDEDRALASEIGRRLNDDWSPAELVDLKAGLQGSSALQAPLPLLSRGRGENDAGGGATELALCTREDSPPHFSASLRGVALAETWHGALAGPSVRRAARLADRVLVVLRAGSLSVFELMRVATRLGRADGVGFLVVNIDEETEKLPDRVGPVEQFWRTHRA